MKFKNTTILIVDDEKDICSLVADILIDEGYHVKYCLSQNDAKKIIEETGITLLITDIWMNDNENAGLELLEWCKKRNSLIPVIVMSGHGTIESAMTAAKNGAYDFIEKPFNSDRLLLLVEKALNERLLKLKLLDAENEWMKSSDLVGKSNFIKSLKNLLEKVSKNNSRVLISGPSGSGKETCARYLHMNSSRANQPFVVASCATLSSQMVDQLLFGWSTDQNKIKESGLFEQANHGSLFFNEICDLPLETQGKLIHLIQDQSFYNIGTNTKVSLDVRIISASSHNLIDAINSGKLREDLYYRLSVVPVEVSPLSKRSDDITLLISHFMKIASKLLNKYELDLSNEVIALLQSYDWPGNIRQLKNLIEWLLIMYGNSKNYKVKLSELPPEILQHKKSMNLLSQNNFNLPLKDARKKFEKNYLENQLLRFKGNIARTSVFVGMDRSALHRKIKELNINLEES